MRGYPLTLWVIFILAALTAFVYSQSYPAHFVQDRTHTSTTNDEPTDTEFALQFLRDLQSTEESYRSFYSENDRYGTIKELITVSQGDSDPLIPPEFSPRVDSDYAIKNGYCFQIFLAPGGDDYCAYAWPTQLGTTGYFSYFVYDSILWRLGAVYGADKAVPVLDTAFQGGVFTTIGEAGKPRNDNHLWKLVPDTR